jgi:Sec-independent protein secretion pathway component TatC
VLLVKFNVVKTKMVSGKRKYIYAGLAIAAMLISPGATPIGDLYLFLALASLVEISIFVGKRFERGKPPSTGMTTLTQFFSNEPTCRYCNQEIASSRNGYCPHCRMPIS